MTSQRSPQIRILIADPFSIQGVTLLRQELPTVRINEHIGLKPEQLRRIITDYTALIVRSTTRVTDDILEAASQLKVVARAGVGLDNIDLDAAERRGIQVINSPGGNVEAVAEHTISLLLALARHIPQANASITAGKWEKSRFIGSGIRDKTLGILGLGRIGSLVAELATGLHLRVLAYDPNPQAEGVALLQHLGGQLLPTMDEVLVQADFLSLHVAPLARNSAAPYTWLIGTRELKLLKPSARLINCARGGLVNEMALLYALKEGRLAGAALDVFSQEPIANSEVLSLLLADERVIATPHLGGSTREAQAHIALDIATQLVPLLRSLENQSMPRELVSHTVI